MSWEDLRSDQTKYLYSTTTFISSDTNRCQRRKLVRKWKIEHCYDKGFVVIKVLMKSVVKKVLLNVRKLDRCRQEIKTICFRTLEIWSFHPQMHPVNIPLHASHPVKRSHGRGRLRTARLFNLCLKSDRFGPDWIKLRQVWFVWTSASFSSRSEFQDVSLYRMTLQRVENAPFATWKLPCQSSDIWQETCHKIDI